MSDMLKEFDRICRKYNIRYFLIGGSLIGALAYKGWIPWDGDVDLEVCEYDYPLLEKVIQKELPKYMWFQNNYYFCIWITYNSKQLNIFGYISGISSGVLCHGKHEVFEYVMFNKISFHGFDEENIFAALIPSFFIRLNLQSIFSFLAESSKLVPAFLGM